MGSRDAVAASDSDAADDVTKLQESAKVDGAMSTAGLPTETSATDSEDIAIVASSPTLALALALALVIFAVIGWFRGGDCNVGVCWVSL